MAGNPAHLNFNIRYLGSWVPTSSYTAGQVVLDDGGDIYLCVGPSRGEDPSASTSGNWQPYDPPGGTSLSATIAGAVSPTPRTLVVIGDSLTEKGGQISANVNRTRESFWTWGLNLIGQRLTLLANLGVGGEVSASILLRINAAIALNPAWIHILAGTNDVGTSVAMSATKANLTSMFDAVKAAKIRLIVGTIPPRNGSTAAQMNATTDLNMWIRDQAATRGFVLCDYEAALLDPVTGQYPAGTGYTTDGIHTVSWGAFAMGRVFAEALLPFVPAGAPLAPQPGVLNLLGASGRAFIGDGSPAGGWKPGNYTVAPTNTRVTRTDTVFGQWQQVVVPVGDISLYNVNVTVDGTTLSVGDTVEMLFEYDISALDAAPAAGTAWFTARTQLYISGGFAGANMRFDLWGTSGIENFPTADRRGIFRTPPLTILTGTTLVQCLIECRGGGTYRFGRAVLRKV